MYHRGVGVSKDDTEAVKWYHKAADQGQAEAQWHLGGMCYKGMGVSQDYEEAARWYRKAADQGNADAQTMLGLMYSAGKGVSQDDKEAIKWLRKAAGQGDAGAQLTIGMMYEDGMGVSKDHKEAVRWLRLAAFQGDRDAASELVRVINLNWGPYTDISISIANDRDRDINNLKILIKWKDSKGELLHESPLLIADTIPSGQTRLVKKTDDATWKLPRSLSDYLTRA